MQKIEIMAPVGSYESLSASIQARADAVYFGVEALNMRARSSQNFTIDDLQQIAQCCQEHGMRSYLTLNTVVYGHELALMRSIIDSAIQAGISAVIASDLAVISYAHAQGMEVHISTQCNISNIEAVRFFAAYADVMVTARELTIDQVSDIIASIEKEDIRGPKGERVQIEIFAHGALCMAISGKCYLSLDHFAQSANRGSCYQLCRRPYKVTDLDGEVELEIDNEYIMSPKDLNTIEIIDRIVNAGVRVLKIEGRGRSADYVYTVVKVYKEAVEAIEQGTYTAERITQWNKELSTVYNRGFWEGYYLGRKMGEWTDVYGSQATRRKHQIGKVTNFFKKINVAEIQVEGADLHRGSELMVIGATTGVYEAIVDELRMDDATCECVPKGSVCSIRTDRELHRGDKVFVCTTQD